MNDSFTTALNTQRATNQWINVLADNMTNVYTPGFKENKINFQTFLGGAIIDNPLKSFGQGKSTPGTSNENLFFEGSGFFIVRNADGRLLTLATESLSLTQRVFIELRMVMQSKAIS